MAALSYAFDPSKGETPETIARRRQTADLIAARIFGKAPANVGEGLNAIGQALIARQMQGEANDAMKAGMATAPEMFGGTGANPAAGIAASITGQPIAPTPSVATPAGQTSIPGGSSEFTNTVMPLAEDASTKTGVDPRIIGAQAILETGNGKSMPGNNLFGIKSHGQPGGNVLPTTEVVNGQPVRTTDSFAAYASPQDSANGYSNFLQSNPRYKPMMAAPTLEGQAAALGQSGYATDPNYGSKVLGIAKGLPAPTGGILADNSASPLDNAQYPAGPVGAPTQAAGAPAVAPANNGEDALPANAQPAQGALPTAQAVPTQRGFLFPKASDEMLQSAYKNAFTPKPYRDAILSEMKMRAEALQKANDPASQVALENAKLQGQKLQADLKEKKTIVVNGRLVDAQTGELVKDFSDIGKTPEGYKAVRDDSGNVVAMQPLPGSEADTKNKATQQKQDQQKEAQNRYGDIVTQDIDRALKGIDSASLPVTGAIGSMTSNIPGTASHDVASLLSTIKANIGFDRLQQMRASSPTGGALGQVSDFENKLLQATIGNLEQSQSKAQLKQNLNRVYNTYMDIIHGPGNGPARRPLDGVAPSATPDRSAIEAEMKRRGLL